MTRGNRQHLLELRIPPVVLGIFTAVLMWIASSTTPNFAIAIPARRWIAVCLMLTGVIICGLGVVSFRRAKTTVNPMRPEAASALVSSGIYRRTRNPMYLGFLLVLSGWAVFLSNILAFLALPAFVLYMNRFQIEPEEKALAATFGPQFVAYKNQVRRWL